MCPLKSPGECPPLDPREFFSQAYFDAAEHMARHPIPPKELPEEEKSLVRSSAMRRLRWNTLAPPSTVEVLDFNEAGEVCWRPLLSNPKHPLANEPVTELPRSQMRVVFAMVHYWECWFDMEMEPPPPLLIDNADGRDVTIEQFIMKVSEYAVIMREQIFECEGRIEEEWQGACLYFDWVRGPRRKEVADPEVLFVVDLLSNSTSWPREIEENWVRMEKRFLDRQGE